MLKQREQKIHTQKKNIWTGRNKTTLKNTKTKIQQKYNIKTTTISMSRRQSIKLQCRKRPKKVRNVMRKCNETFKLINIDLSLSAILMNDRPLFLLSCVYSVLHFTFFPSKFPLHTSSFAWLSYSPPAAAVPNSNTRP